MDLIGSGFPERKTTFMCDVSFPASTGSLKTGSVLCVCVGGGVSGLVGEH